MTNYSPIWRPFTQMKTAPEPLKVVRGHGAILKLEDGTEIIDCISSWWVNIHGHSNPDIAKAIYEQAIHLEHVMFAGFTHDAAEVLAARLLPHFPASLRKIFYSDNGSTAVEVALKMAYQYWYNKGQADRDRFIGFEGGYHGDTVGAMSIAGSSPFWQRYKRMMPEFDAVSYPLRCDDKAKTEENEADTIKQLKKLVSSKKKKYAAICIEPLVQGAGGMRMCSEEFLVKLQKFCRENDLLLIFDEVMTGFGRTGDWFAAKKANVEPDIMCVSKGITGGFLPLAVTACAERIYESFLSDDPQDMFAHGHSYTANPIACAAAIKSLELLEADTRPFTEMESKHRGYAGEFLSSIKTISNLRYCGTIVAFEVEGGGKNNYYNELGPLLKQKFLEEGLLIRPLGNTVYLMPPYCITENLSFIYYKIAKVINSL
ncbi:MAG: adenosylmethionine--8-amino-7-oxononanoate transaminase [Candidatus Melainabacteria bacterium]|nr:MAG: adenosylmethionine--8-amino-7-oxononanoate transaminase [Candidatus Melainabacteria bacterium]